MLRTTWRQIIHARSEYVTQMSSNWSSLVTETQLMLFLKRKAREVQPEVERPNIEPRWWEYCERYWLTSTKPSLPLKMCEVN